MISLGLENYCHEGCTRFEPRVLRGIRVTDSDIIVTCEHAAECQYMMRYLKKHNAERKEDTDVLQG